jgi:hypothetical protein
MDSPVQENRLSIRSRSVAVGPFYHSVTGMQLSLRPFVPAIGHSRKAFSVRPQLTRQISTWHGSKGQRGELEGHTGWWMFSRRWSGPAELSVSAAPATGGTFPSAAVGRAAHPANQTCSVLLLDRSALVGLTHPRTGLSRKGLRWVTEFNSGFHAWLLASGFLSPVR